MGADMYIESFALPINVSYEKFFKSLIKHYREYSIEHFKYIVRERLCADIDELDPLEDTLMAVAGKNSYEDQIYKEFEKWLITINNLPHRRDITNIIHSNDIIYLSGGMSYGDTPTESCDDLSILNDLPLDLIKQAISESEENGN